MPSLIRAAGLMYPPAPELSLLDGVFVPATGEGELHIAVRRQRPVVDLIENVAI